MNSTLKKVYDQFPSVAQNLILTAYSALLDKQRYGGEFQKYQQFFEESQWYSAHQLEEYQNRQLEKIINHAYKTVPYYTRIFDEYGVNPSEIQNVSDLHKLPILRKKDITENFEALISNKIAKKSIRFGHTSGTTGAPLEIAYDPSVVYATYAVLDRQYKWANTKLKRFGDRVAVIRGNVIVPLEADKPPFWRYNYYHNQMLLSSFHLKTENLPHYINELKRYQPAVLDGYPSTLYVLAKYLKNTGQTLPLHAVLSSSETLFDFQRETIEESFQCRIFDYFGAAERVIFATECDQHSGHHLCEEYGVTEILDKDLKSVSIGGTGTIVATSLHNYAMPMIRYFSNDMTALKPEMCGCGREHRLMEDVTTKAEDLLTLRDGRLISPSVLTHPFKPMDCIEGSQIIQEDLDNIVIKIVPNENYEERKGLKLIQDLKERVGENVNIEINLVDELPRTKSGKFKWVISKVELGI